MLGLGCCPTERKAFFPHSCTADRNSGVDKLLASGENFKESILFMKFPFIWLNNTKFFTYRK